MSTRNLDDDSKAGHLADDPNFMARVSDLDDGMPEQRQAVSPTAHASSAAASPAKLPPVVATPGGRQLMDLFPELEIPSEDELRAAAAAPLPVARLFIERRRPIAQSERAAPPAAYQAFYGLTDRPFGLAPDPRFLFQSSEYDRVAQHVLGAIRNHEPLLMITGEVGIGKTTLCRAVLEQLDRHTLTSLVTDPFDSVSDLLKTLLLDFGVASRDDVSRGRLASASQAELSGTLRDFLISLGPLQAFAVVFLDEAQALRSGVLGELHHIVSADERLMQIVLVGQPSLAATLDRSAPELARAMSLRLTLGPLADSEVGGYVSHRLQVAGANSRVEFEPPALERLHALSSGKPRLVNLLCDRALLTGFQRSAQSIDEQMIVSAAEDLDIVQPLVQAIGSRAPNIRLLLLLMLAGAAAAALTFRAELASLFSGH